VRKVRSKPFQKSARNSRLKNAFMTPSLSAQRTIVKARVTQITAGEVRTEIRSIEIIPDVKTGRCAACVYPTNHAE
jgi:hypothetical protein